jgi:uncharacterized membrane protein
MQKDRLTALTDGVIAVIITIMVLELKPPHGVDLSALAASWPVFLSYVLSFIYVAIYWNNHHHFFQLVDRVDGAILWANMHLLFWLSLVPFATAWMGEHPAAAVPTALYGGALLMSAVAWLVMQAVIVHAQGPDSAMRRALGRDLKSKLSVALYLAGVGLAFLAVWAADLVYAGVALLWLIPDRRMAAARAAAAA